MFCWIGILTLIVDRFAIVLVKKNATCHMCRNQLVPQVQPPFSQDGEAPRIERRSETSKGLRA